MHFRLIRRLDAAAGNILELAIVGIQRFLIDVLPVSLDLQCTIGLVGSSSEFRAAGLADEDGCDNVDELVRVQLIVAVDCDAEGCLAVGGGVQFTGATVSGVMEGTGKFWGLTWRACRRPGQVQRFRQL